MNSLSEKTDIVEQLTADIEKLQTELNEEKALREEVEEKYEYLKQQYEQAIDFIKNYRRPSSNGGGGCLFFVLLLTILFILMLYIMNINIPSIAN